MNTKINEVIETLLQIEKDCSVPKNTRSKIKDAIKLLNEKDTAFDIKVNKLLQELDDLDNDPNLPPYTRTQIWNVVSILESI